MLANGGFDAMSTLPIFRVRPKNRGIKREINIFFFLFFLPWQIGCYNISSLLVMQNPDI
jgi:hypothetical protein